MQMPIWRAMRRPSLLVIGSVLSVLASEVAARRHAWQEPPAGGRPVAAQASDAPRPPVLLVRERDEPSTPLSVESARYDVTILNHVARTRATLVFHNASDRIYEGELVYPL